MFTSFRIVITLLREMLGTNPCNPNVLDKHIHDKQRRLILDKSQINTEINKYLDALPISKEKGNAEIEKLFAKLEDLTGIKLKDDEKKRALAGDLEALKETFAELETTGTTVFFWDNEKNQPCIGDHMIYGFLKAAADALGKDVRLTKLKGTILHSTAYTQSVINQHVRCTAPFITFDRDVRRNEDGTAFLLERSLRAKTAQGERIALARSEVVPAGARLDFVVNFMAGSPLIHPIQYKKGEKPFFEKIPLIHLLDYGQMTGLGQWRNAGHGAFQYEATQIT